MTELAPWLAGFLLTYGLHGAVALILIAGLQRGTGPWSPARRDGVWKAAVAGTLLTAIAATVGPVGRGSRIGMAEVRREIVLRQDDGSDTVRQETVTLPARSARAPDCRSVLHSRELPGQARTDRIHQTCAGVPAGLPSGVVLLWLAGALLGAGRLRYRRTALRRHLGPWTPLADGPARRTLARLRRSGAGPDGEVRLVASPGLASPAVLAPTVIGLPVGAEEALPPGELEAVLAHELAHLERGDPLWTSVLGVLGAVFWYQPILGRAHREVRDAAELLCDDRAVSRTGAPLELARALARVGGWVVGSTPAPELAVVRPAEGRLEGRVSRLLALDGTRPPAVAWGQWAARVVGAFVVASMVLLPAVRLPGPPRVEVVQDAPVLPPTSPDGLTL